MFMLGSCGAAATALQDEFVQQVRSNLPSQHNSTNGSTSGSTGGSTTAPASTSGVSIASMLAQHNQLRSSLGLPALKANSTLSLVAQRQAAYMSSIGNISHYDASGGQVWDRADGAGYNWTTIGENVAYSTQPQGIFNLWKGSPGHYQNMVNPAYSEIGLGRVVNGRTEYWSVVFAHPALK